MSSSFTGNLFRAAAEKIAKSLGVGILNLPPDFDAENYFKLNPDLRYAQVNPFQHYISVGEKEGRLYKDDMSKAAHDGGFELPEGFDEEEYRSLHSDLANYRGNLSQHYIEYGAPELRVYRHSTPPLLPKIEKYSALPSDFNPEVYLELNQDLAGQPISPYDHYVEFGRFEKRLYRPQVMMACFGKQEDPSKPTVLLVSHAASRTGAPVLSWNILKQLNSSHNVVILLLDKGALVSNFQQDATATYVTPALTPTCDPNDLHAKQNHVRAKHIINQLMINHSFDFAILNSIETSLLCKPLSMNGVPSLLLIHEFVVNTMPREKFLDAMVWASVPIFSTQLTKDDAKRAFPGHVFENALVLPQGRCAIPQDPFNEAIELNSSVFSIAKLGGKATDRKLIIGIGSVNIRKGVDIFIEVASQMCAQQGTDALHFLWVGQDDPVIDTVYTSFLIDQIQRSGLGSRISIVTQTDELQALYEAASLLLLTSRLDPLPNIAIDAICTGLPLVCFSKASGIADVLSAHGLEEQCVARFIDPSDMARKALRLMDPGVANDVRRALLALGDSSFSLSRYCGELMSLQNVAAGRLASATLSVDRLTGEKLFDATYYAGQPLRVDHEEADERDRCWDYVMTTRAGSVGRKPALGFSPLVYRERLQLDPAIDPLLHYCASNREDSNYQEPPLISPQTYLLNEPTTVTKTALHIHVYYVDMLPDILDRILKNTSRVDIFISVDSGEKKEQVQQLLKIRNSEHAQTSVHHNLGRDVYPFLSVFEAIKDNYELIGHVHTKKSPHVITGDLISRWRELLLGNLLGSEFCPNMLDRIVAYAAANPNIDIIFPDDPHIIGWTENIEVVKELFPREEFDKLPRHFDFPVGTMFWARTEYLRTISLLDIQNKFEPLEPLPIDGTILHAWERILGAKASIGDPKYAMTFVSELTR